jgi:hypothetical protein
MGVNKDDSPTFTGNMTILGTLNVGGTLTVGGNLVVSGFITSAIPKFTNSLSGDVALNNIANFFDGPTVAQGTVGTWFASGNVTLVDTTAVSAGIICKLWDGTTVIDSTIISTIATNAAINVHLSGYIVNPAGNLRISCKDVTATTGKILFNTSGAGKDSTVSAYRIG